MNRPTLTVRAASFLLAACGVLAAAPSAASGAPAVPTQLNAADMSLLNGVRQAGLREIPAGQMAAERGLLLLSPVAAYAEPDVPVPPNELISDDGEGSVSAADKDLVVKVRLAGLWEIPAGEMAQEKSNDPRIQKIGREIAKQHEVLDAFDRAAAKKLKIVLPKKPNSDQQGWLAEMRDADGDEFDEIYIDRLRAAHGKIFPAIGTVRATTRNDTVRKLAQQANQFVVTHMTLLESSDIVDFAALPTAPDPAAAPSSAPVNAARQVPAASTSSLSGMNLFVTLLALAAGLGVGVFATMRFAGSRRRPHRGRW